MGRRDGRAKDARGEKGYVGGKRIHVGRKDARGEEECIQGKGLHTGRGDAYGEKGCACREEDAQVEKGCR